jgi:hypothetical protein
MIASSQKNAVSIVRFMSLGMRNDTAIMSDQIQKGMWPNRAKN